MADEPEDELEDEMDEPVANYYVHLVNNPGYSQYLLSNFNANPSDPYYFLTADDFAVLAPDVVRTLMRERVNVGSHISALPYEPIMQVALLVLIRHPDDPSRARHGDPPITLQGQTPPHQYEINEDDIEALREAVVPELRAAADAAAAQHLAAAAGAAPFTAEDLAAENPHIRIMPPRVARRAMQCARGDECPISMEPVVDMVVTSCGHPFERSYIDSYIRDGGKTCPKCRNPFVINPLHIRDVAGREFSVPHHMIMPLAVQALREGNVGRPSPTYHACKRCGKVVPKKPAGNICPTCKQHDAFRGGSRSRKCNKKNSRRKSKKSIKRTKTIKRR
jgi:hypothetical protein